MLFHEQGLSFGLWHFILDYDILRALPSRLDEFAPLTILKKKNASVKSIFAKTCSWRTKAQNPINWQELHTCCHQSVD